MTGIHAIHLSAGIGVVLRFSFYSSAASSRCKARPWKAWRSIGTSSIASGWCFSRCSIWWAGHDRQPSKHDPPALLQGPAIVWLVLIVLFAASLAPPTCHSAPATSRSISSSPHL